VYPFPNSKPHVSAGDLVTKMKNRCCVCMGSSLLPVCRLVGPSESILSLSGDVINYCAMASRHEGLIPPKHHHPLSLWIISDQVALPTLTTGIATGQRQRNQRRANLSTKDGYFISYLDATMPIIVTVLSLFVLPLPLRRCPAPRQQSLFLSSKLVSSLPLTSSLSRAQSPTRR
jgi:hypothetical protein